MKAQKIAAWLIIVTFVIALLIIGKPFLVPLFLGIVIWYLINAINQVFRTNSWIDQHIPGWLSLTIASISILLFLILIGNLIAQNINTMIASTPDYRVNLEQQLQRILSTFGYTKALDFDTLATDFNLNDYIRRLINSMTGIASSFFLILIYVIFLLIEQGTFTQKIAALGLSSERKEHLKNILQDINQASRTYILVKFAASLLTGFLSFLVLRIIGVDFALFWAFLIFVLNFIPTIGSIIATAFPALVALIQFDSLGPFFTILIGIVAIQVLIGSFLEPRLLGNTLNISPFVVIVSLALWGMIWGIVGMLLCVPLTVILIIVFAQFPNTLPIAIILSKRGQVGRNLKKDAGNPN